MPDSVQLLRAYAKHGDEAAFGELVARYIHLVYSVAVRRVGGDAEAARDVTQTVFIDLARKARSLRGAVMLGGWLHRHTGFVAARVVRAERRRQAREQHAAAMNTLHPTPDPTWQQLAPVLDETIDALDAADRQAILLRFFEQRDFHAVGAALGISDDAAQKRVSRAVEKLRTILAKRGVTSTAAALAGVLADRAVGAAPAGLAMEVSRAAFAAGAAGSSFLALFKLTTLAKLQLLLGTAAVVVLITAPIWFPRAYRRTTAASREVEEQASTISKSPPGLSGTSNLLAAVQPPSLAAPDSLQLLVVADDTGQPIPRARVEYWATEKGQSGSLGPATPLTATEAGVCEVPAARNATGALLIRSRTDGFVDTSLSWSVVRGEAIPQHYTLRLKPAVPISGRVVDTEGSPVAGAEVRIQVRDTLAAPSKTDREVPHVSTFAGEKAVTDAEGRWRINRFAKQAIPTISGGATHPDFVADVPSNFAFEHEAQERLLASTYVFTLDRGVTLRGVVLDSGGRPVPEAKVVTRALTRFRDTTSQADGSFTLTGCKLGANQFRVEARGFAPVALDVDLTNNPAPVRLTLQPGKLLRLRVGDINGRPVPKATVMLNTDPTIASGNFRPSQVMMSPRSLYRWQTDAEGRLAWGSAPDRELSFDVSAPDHMSVDEVKVRPDGQEHTIALAPALTISGIVRDADTGRPVPHFCIIPGGLNWHVADNTTNFEWRAGYGVRVNSEDGSFRSVYTEPPEGGWFAFKFQADGYAPFVTRHVQADEGKVQFRVALQAVLTATVTVLLPDGRPAADADIGLVSPGAQLKLAPGGFSRASFQSSGSLLSTDDQGRFTLPADDAITRVIAAHPEGYAETTPAALGADPAIRLQPWGRLEGRFLSGGQPAAGRALWFQYGPGDFHTVSSDFNAYQVITDSVGRFVFAQVPPGNHKLVQSVQEPGMPVRIHSPLLDVEIRPGEMKTVTVGTYTVTAHPGWPADLKREADWRVFGYMHTLLPPRPADGRSNPQALAAWRETPEVKAAYANMRHYRLTETAEGEMMAEDVAAGSYVLSVDVSEAPTGGKAKLHAYGEIRFTVPADPPSGTLDLGEIALQPVP